MHTSEALGARGLRCSPYTSLMAICGHYSPPMSHNHAPECSLCSCRPAAVGFSRTLPLLLLLLLTVAVVIEVYSLILTHSNKPYWPTSVPAAMRRVVYLPARWLRYTHLHIHMPNMDSLMEDPLTLILLAEYILFILVQSPALTPHLLCAAPSISLCLSALVYQPVSGPSCGLDH